MRGMRSISYSIKQGKKSRSIIMKILLFICYLLIIFFIAEALFMFIPISHGVGYTLAAQLWVKKYWKPINQFNFRDYEIDTSITAKRKIFVLGDSFVAGQGLKSVENRFSNIVSKRLPKRYYVVNMGINGVDTLREKEILNSFPYKPDILILVYSPNDIGDRAIANGNRFEGFVPYADLNPLLKLLVQKSYFLNFVYWQFPHEDCRNYINFLKKSYSSKSIFNAHLHDLTYFINYSKDNKIPLYVIIFPYFNFKLSQEQQEYLGKIADLFVSQQIETIVVSDLIKNIPFKKLIVNKMDIHPNELANKIVADELLKQISRNEHIF